MEEQTNITKEGEPITLQLADLVVKMSKKQQENYGVLAERSSSAYKKAEELKLNFKPPIPAFDYAP